MNFPTSPNRTNTDQRPLALICDDEELILDLLEHHLTNANFEVVRASDGAEALDAIARQPPAVVVLDIMMPVVNGSEVLRRVRATPEWRHIPVLLLTMRGSQDDLVEGFEDGASDYLTKPFMCGDLIARINRLVKPARIPKMSSCRP